MTGSAQLDFGPEHDFGPQHDFGSEHASAAAEARTSELRQQVAARVAAHRQRRAHPSAPAAGEGATPSPSASPPRPPKRRNPIAATIAERYAQTPSYRAFLAEQAQRATEQAAASAEIALRNAEAVAAVQQQLLGELELWHAHQDFTPATAQPTAQPDVQPNVQPNPQPIAAPSVAAQPIADPPVAAQPFAAPSVAARLPSPTPDAAKAAVVAGLTVRLYDDLGPLAAPPPRPSGAPAISQPGHEPEEFLALDAEIAFRQSPVFEDYKAYLQREAEPPVPLPANLLEFPRQLIAPRKARPRLAEGPLRDDPAARTRQLRIFEVEAEQIATAPAPLPAAPEWSSIRLGAHAVTEPDAHPESPLSPSLLPPHTAPGALRMMAFLVDLGLVLLASLASAALFLRLAGELPGIAPAALAASVTLFVFYILYQLLFFSLNGQTPGMRYARIGFCTFNDENPSRSAMCRRILAQLIALCPMGLGLLWALLDDEGLGWHDRISRMYQRAY